VWCVLVSSVVFVPLSVVVLSSVKNGVEVVVRSLVKNGVEVVVLSLVKNGVEVDVLSVIKVGLVVVEVIGMRDIVIVVVGGVVGMYDIEVVLGVVGSNLVTKRRFLGDLVSGWAVLLFPATILSASKRRKAFLSNDNRALSK
jgi:hypothetical protein